MKKLNRARLMQVHRSKVGSRSIISNTLAVLLCFVSGVTGASFLFESHFQTRASSPKQKEVGKLSPTTLNLPEWPCVGRVVQPRFPPINVQCY